MNRLTISAGSNCYLVSVGEKIMMIDAGDPTKRQKIEDGLESNKINMNDISYLFLTHGHIDHIGNAAYFQKKYGMKIIMHEKDLPLISDNFSQNVISSSLMGSMIKMFGGMSVKKNPLETFVPDYVITGVAAENRFGMGETIYLLPGHTQGSMGIRFPTGEFFAGDLLMNMTGPHAAYIWENEAALKASIDAVGNLPIHTVYIGHGKPVSVENLKKI